MDPDGCSVSASAVNSYTQLWACIAECRNVHCVFVLFCFVWLFDTIRGEWERVRGIVNDFTYDWAPDGGKNHELIIESTFFLFLLPALHSELRWCIAGRFFTEIRWMKFIYVLQSLINFRTIKTIYCFHSLSCFYCRANSLWNYRKSLFCDCGLWHRKFFGCHWTQFSNQMYWQKHSNKWGNPARMHIYDISIYHTVLSRKLFTHLQAIIKVAIGMYSYSSNWSYQCSIDPFSLMVDLKTDKYDTSVETITLATRCSIAIDAISIFSYWPHGPFHQFCLSVWFFLVQYGNSYIKDLA